MKWYQATLDEKMELAKGFEDNFKAEGYSLDFSDLKEGSGFKINYIKQKLLYNSGIAKQVGSNFVSIFKYPAFCPFEKDPFKIDDELNTQGYSLGEHCVVFLMEYKRYGYDTYWTSKTLFNQKALEKLLKEKEAEAFFEKEGDLDWGLEDSGDPFEDEVK